LKYGAGKDGGGVLGAGEVKVLHLAAKTQLTNTQLNPCEEDLKQRLRHYAVPV
jgi:hypothetical protein